MFTKCSCLKEEENGQGKQGVKGKAMGGGSEMSRSFVLKHLCFSLTVKPWTSHLISWGLNRRGQRRCYLWSLLAWTLSGSNLNQNPEVCKGRWAILSTHTETHCLRFADLREAPGPTFLQHASPSVWVPTHPVPRHPGFSCCPETPHLDPQQETFLRATFRFLSTPQYPQQCLTHNWLWRNAGSTNLFGWLTMFTFASYLGAYRVFTHLILFFWEPPKTAYEHTYPTGKEAETQGHRKLSTENLNPDPLTSDPALFLHLSISVVSL